LPFFSGLATDFSEGPMSDAIQTIAGVIGVCFIFWLFFRRI
jgi:hypothetical protein